MPAGQPDTGDLAQRRVRLLRRGGVHARAHAAPLRAALERRRLGLARSWPVRPLRTSCWIVGTGSLRSLRRSSLAAARLAVLSPVCQRRASDPRGRACRRPTPRARPSRRARVSGVASRASDGPRTRVRCTARWTHARACPGKPGHEGKEYPPQRTQVKTGSARLHTHAGRLRITSVTECPDRFVPRSVHLAPQAWRPADAGRSAAERPGTTRQDQHSSAERRRSRTRPRARAPCRSPFRRRRTGSPPARRICRSAQTLPRHHRRPGRGSAASTANAPATERARQPVARAQASAEAAAPSSADARPEAMPADQAADRRARHRPIRAGPRPASAPRRDGGRPAGRSARAALARAAARRTGTRRRRGAAGTATAAQVRHRTDASESVRPTRRLRTSAGRQDRRARARRSTSSQMPRPGETARAGGLRAAGQEAYRGGVRLRRGLPAPAASADGRRDQPAHERAVTQRQQARARTTARRPWSSGPDPGRAGAARRGRHAHDAYPCAADATASDRAWSAGSRRAPPAAPGRVLRRPGLGSVAVPSGTTRGRSRPAARPAPLAGPKP